MQVQPSYQETHLQTINFFGLVNLQIGNGTVVTGVFDTLSWSTQSYYIKVEADTSGGSNFIALGTTQLLAVPYALHAEDASSAASSTMIRDSDGETKVTTELTPDDNQIRFYTGGQERLRLIGTRLEMTSGNILIGGESGKAITSGGGNVFIGDSSGACNTEGSINTFLGTWSGAKNTTGNSNTFIGFLSGNDNTTGSSNTFIGMLSGRHNTTGYVNTFVEECFQAGGIHRVITAHSLVMNRVRKIRQVSAILFLEHYQATIIRRARAMCALAMLPGLKTKRGTIIYLSAPWQASTKRPPIDSTLQILTPRNRLFMVTLPKKAQILG